MCLNTVSAVICASPFRELSGCLGSSISTSRTSASAEQYISRQP